MGKGALVLRSVGRWLSVTMSMVTVLGVLSVASADADPVGKTPYVEPAPALTLPPEVDDFYRPSSAVVAATPPGGIIRARQIIPAVFSIDPVNADAWQLLYRTNDSHGQAIATVTTVLKPRGTAPAGGRKLLSYQTAEDALAQYCAPSYVIQHGNIPINAVTAAEVSLPMLLGLSQGWAVSVPDWEGPNSALGAAVLGGHATLDGIRAAENFAPLELSAGTKTPVAMMGYSGGTIPSGWATEFQAEYAPELNVVATVIGGVALADGPSALRVSNGNIAAGLIGSVIAGLLTEYPEVRPVWDRYYDPFGKIMLKIKSFNCAQVNVLTFPFWNYLGSYTGPGDPLQLPEVKKMIDQIQLGQRRPTIPMYIYNSQLDELIPVAGTDHLVGWYCQDPTKVSVRYERELLSEHAQGMLAWAPHGYQFIRDRLNGVPAQRGCQTSSPITSLTDGQLIAELGKLFPAAIQTLTGYPVGIDHR